MSGKHQIQGRTDPRGGDAVTIRIATDADRSALLRLAELDSVPPSRREALDGAHGTDRIPSLIAELDGELRAAFPLDGGPPIADPFHHTAKLVALLRARAAELQATSPSRSGIELPLPVPQPAERPSP